MSNIHFYKKLSGQRRLFINSQVALNEAGAVEQIKVLRHFLPLPERGAEKDSTALYL